LPHQEATELTDPAPNVTSQTAMRRKKKRKRRRTTEMRMTGMTKLHW
jgi:hypothetical protein